MRSHRVQRFMGSTGLKSMRIRIIPEQRRLPARSSDPELNGHRKPRRFVMQTMKNSPMDGE